MSAAPLLEVADLNVRLAVPHGRLHVVNNVDLQVGRGETLCLVGESGCGKSMVALSLMRLLPRVAGWSAGHLRLDGQDLSVLDDRAFAAIPGNRIAMIFQDPMTAFNPVMPLGEQLFEGFLRHRRGDRRQAREKALHLLDRLNVPAAARRLKQYPHELSGGLRQRMMIAMALMCDPALVIADEPTTALDVTIQALTLRLLAELQREMDLGLILVTHDLGLVSRMADRVAVMYAGQIVETADRRSLFAEPRHPYTRGLIDCVPVPGRHRAGGRLGTIEGSVPMMLEGVPGCRFANRCAFVRGACRAQAPPVRQAGGRSWRCIWEGLPASEDALQGAS
ncbi:ABC transporter ATP-binding protein [Marinibaculum pumilum]|uniref:ABC transporter ATP-binding protein n=1 Tax=Marinibaculum pumilum TaxID=1766165 RepID=A0ABV7KZ59_9PROT